MKTINANTKQGQRFIDSYNRSNVSRLDQIYNSYSTAKARAELWCLSTYANEEGSTGYRIISYSCMVFTVAWRTKDGCLRVETRDNSYLIK